MGIDCTPEEITQHELQVNVEVEAFFTVWHKVRHQMVGAHFKQRHQNGMSATQFMILAMMEEAQGHEPCTISFFASQLGLDPATVVRTVDSLEKRGLVERRRDTQDRRVVFVEFTEAGLAEQQAARQRFKDRLSLIVRGMSEEGRDCLLKGLQEFVDRGLQVNTQNSPL
ncbi:MAG: hypothetical protein NVS4B11_35080 [Ktedonobacteraceae bacterium]